MNEAALSEIYRKNWEIYSNSKAKWDYVILTASNAEQAKWFESQIEDRRSKGFLPSETVFGVVPDPIGERVGNGGAAFGSFRYVANHRGSSDFRGLKVLVILSSGDAKRVAQYSSIGKVFSPVPRVLPNGCSSTLFDEIMLSVSGIPENMEEGFLILSGDVLLVFDPSQFCVIDSMAAAIAFKEPAEMGTGHGIFMDDDLGFIRDVWHKLPVSTMQEYGAIDENGCVNIDTGAVFFTPEIVGKLFSLICEENGECTDQSFCKYVNGVVQPSLYVDFFYPLSQTATFEGYMREVPEGRMCDELLEARKEFWRVLRPYRIRLLKISPAKFIDFGTTKDVMDLMSNGIADYGYLGWQRIVNSVVPSGNAAFESISESSSLGKDCYLEYSKVSNSSVGEKTILSFVEVSDCNVPSGVALNCIRQKSGKYVTRIYGVKDNPKQLLESGASMFGVPVSVFMEKNGIEISDLWDSGQEHMVWGSKLYNECDSMKDSVEAALNLYELFVGDKGQIESFKTGSRVSLSSSFNNEDGDFLIEWKKKIEELL